MHIKINPKLIFKDKLYGTAKLGERGQLVIPAEARKDLNLKSGDHLLIIGKHGKALGIIKSGDLTEMIEMLLESINDKEWKLKIKQHIKNMFGNISPLKKGSKKQ
ncbi:MAG: AbrB/MazE/SpoVT family DNA-binding domain-containing protein [Candidatus Doudnabacteria bacterium]|nr:AbrB/MazE/SpoVT family DNA-binding domain-containing protein [Candidatus Doudnabacteria bacterium]